MAVVINAKGTSIASFQIGKQGPLVKNNSSVIALRNAADSADASLTADSAVLGSPTDGDKGSGSLNAEALYINGVAVSGGGGLANIVEDTTPQLGGQLDVNGFAIGNGTEELIKFVETPSAVNEITITNAATAGNPIISATGADTNVSLDIQAQGTGSINLDSATVVGSPTGGGQGSGSINTETLYINGVLQSGFQSSFDSDTFTGDGSTTGFTLSRTPDGEDAILVAVSGLLQDGGVDYTVSGTTLTFTTAPPNTAKILVLFRDSFGSAALFRDNFLGTGSQTGFTLTQDPGNATNLLVFIDGVTQYTPDAYTVSGTTLTFTAAPANNADIQTVQLTSGLAASTPGTSTVTYNSFDSSMQGLIGTSKNKIINAAMRISQRGTSFAPATSVYTLDRWLFDNIAGTAVWTASQESSGGVSGNDKWIKALCTTADAAPSNEGFRIEQRIEAQDAQSLIDSTGVVSSVISLDMILHTDAGSSITFPAAVAVGLWAPDGTRQFVGDVSITTADTWQRVTLNVPADASGVINNDTGIGIALFIGLYGQGTRAGTAGSWVAGGGSHTSSTTSDNIADSTNNYLGFTNVQLEVGDTATDFEHRSYGEELALCQRYYQRGFSNGALGVAFSATNSTFGFRLATEMRAIPTVSIISGSTLACDMTHISGALAWNPTAFRFSSKTGFTGYGITASYGAKGNPIEPMEDNIQADAEL